MTYKKFRCQNENCVKLHEDSGEDNRLVLQILEGEIHEYYIADDGSLEHYDSEGTGQDIYLECKICGTKYEFDEDYFGKKILRICLLSRSDKSMISNRIGETICQQKLSK